MSKAKEYRKEFKEAWDKYKEICKRFEHDPEHPMTSRTMVMVIIEEAAQENKELRKDIKNKYVEKDAVIQMIKNEKTYGSFEDARPKIIVASILDKLSTM